MILRVFTWAYLFARERRMAVSSERCFLIRPPLFIAETREKQDPCAPGVLPEAVDDTT